MKDELKKWIKSSYLATVFYFLLTDRLARLKFFSGDIATRSGTIHSALSVEESLNYIEEVFGDYRHYSGCHRFHGRVAEVGPGDNCGVALLFLLDGCERVDLVDRFFSKRNVQAQAAIYQALLLRHPGLANFLRHATLTDETTFGSIERHYGAGAAAETFFAANTGYDFIVSRAVFEHLYDPRAALKCMTAALNSGGCLLHKVDLRDHGMFSGVHHELKFLEVPSWLYSWMTTGSGRPNRVLVHEYRDAMTQLGLEGQLLVTRLAGIGDINPHLPYEDIRADHREASSAFIRSVRKRFAGAFSTVSDEDLSVSGVFLVARKTGERASWMNAQPLPA
jgi:hypothetical protein